LTGASIAAQQHERCFGSLSKPVTPLEFVSSTASLQGVGVLFVTAGGSNVDILWAFQNAVEREATQILILCADASSELVKRAAKYDFVDVVTLDLPAGRDGFLASNSLLAISTVILRAWARASDTLSDLPDDFDEFGFDIGDRIEEINVEARNVWAKDTILVLFGHDTRAAVVDLESKFSEAALGSIQVADYRNFAHGRHHWLAERADTTGIIAFVSESDRDMATKTLALIPKKVPVFIQDVAGVADRVVIESLLQTFFLTASAGFTVGIDPGRPHVPMFGRKLYHLRAYKKTRRSPTQCSDVAVQRKTGRSIEELQAADEVVFWRKAHLDFLDGLSEGMFAAIAFDYDGTLCRPKERFDGIGAEITNRLILLLESGIRIGIATGRGQSVLKDFRAKVPEEFWQDIVIGYYNGGIVSNLREDFKTDRETDPEIAALDKIFSEHDGVSKIFEWETGSLQIRLEPKGGYSALDVLRFVRQLAVSHDLQGLGTLYSSHSVDVVASICSKLNVVKRLKQEIGESMNILRIGDRGRFPGNDCIFLSDSFSLSVDECSLDPNSCWNIAQPGSRGVWTTIEYLDNMTITTGKCHFRAGLGALPTR
jgi:hypothetical protein